MPKKLEGWTLWNFSTSILSQNIKKIEGGIFWWKKISPRKLEGEDPSVSPGHRYCMLREEKEEHFWFNSLGQMVHFTQ